MWRDPVLVAEEPARIEIEPFERALNHALGGQHLRQPDCRGHLDIDDDRISRRRASRCVDKVGLAAMRPRPARHRVGDNTNVGVTSVAAPKAASSRAASYSSIARPVVREIAKESPDALLVINDAAIIHLREAWWLRPPQSVIHRWSAGHFRTDWRSRRADSSPPACYSRRRDAGATGHPFGAKQQGTLPLPVRS